MLKLTIASSGSRSRVELNGVDVSRFFRSVMIRVEAGYSETPTVLLEYLGAAVVEMPDGSVTLQQADVSVTCDECQKQLRGEPQDLKVVDTSRFAQTNRTYEVVQAE